MKDLNALFKKVEKMPKEELFMAVQESSMDIIPALQGVSGKNEESVMMYCVFLHAVLAADGRLADEEFATVAPLMSAVFGNTFDYDACRAQVKKFADNKQIKAEMVDLINRLPEEIAKEMIFVAIAICAIDGKVSKPERDFIEDMLR